MNWLLDSSNQSFDFFPFHYQNFNYKLSLENITILIRIAGDFTFVIRERFNLFMYEWRQNYLVGLEDNIDHIINLLHILAFSDRDEDIIFILNVIESSFRVSSFEYLSRTLSEIMKNDLMAQCLKKLLSQMIKNDKKLSLLQIFLYFSSLRFSTVLLLQSDIVKSVYEMNFESKSEDYVCCLMIILKTIRYVKEAFDSTSFQFYYLNTVRIIKIAWSNQCQFSDSEKSFSLMVLSELSRTGIINPENININQSIKEFVNKIHPIRKEPFLGPVSTSIIQACVTESIWECSELIGAALINIKIQNTDEKFCRSICLSYSMIINMAFTSANMHLIIFMITGTADRTIDLAIKIAQCHRAIISSDQFHAVEINESIGDDELILLPTIFALLAYSSKPCPTNLLNARFKIYFSKPLVDIFICSLEPVLLVLEIFSERFQGNLIESFPILNEMILSFSLMFDKNLSEFMAESIPGIFYFVSNQLWCPVSKSTHYWTIRELTVLAMFFEISKAHLGNRIEECVSFLMGKYHPHILETQYTEHIVRIIIENIKTSSNSQKVYRFIASWAPWIAIDPEFDQYSDFEVTSTITSNVLECRSSNKYEITNQNNMIDIKEFSDDLIEVLNIRRGLTRCSDIQILCTLIIHNCRTWVYQSSMSEDDIMSVNYIVQECLEILQLRQSFDNAWDKDILFSEPWANEFWKRLSTEMKMFLHPLLNSRYSCISQYTVNEFIYEAMSHESFGEILNRFFQTIKIPSALLSRLRSIFVLNLWQGDFPGSMISLESIDDNVLYQVFDIILHVSDYDNGASKIFLNCTFDSLESRLSLISVVQRLFNRGHHYHVIKMCELMMQNGKNHDIQKILHILSVSSQKLGHSAFAEGYKMKLNDESLSSIISHEIMAELEINNQLPSSLKGNILGPKSEGVFLFSEYEKLMASFEDEHWMQTLFVKLRKWAFKSDFYENPFSEITASKYISFNSGRLLDPKLELLVDIPLDCFCENLIIRNIKLNSEIKNELDNSVTISRYLKGVSSNQLQSLCLAANVTINNITKNSEVESNVTLLAVNSLRYLGLNEVALRTLYHSQQVSYWLKNYYAAKILANDLKFDKAVPLLNDALNHVENKTQAMKVAICLAHMMYKSMSYTESKIRTAFAKCFELNHENAKVHFLFSCYVEEISNKDDLEMMYEVMKSYANTAILSDKYDRIACSKVFSILFLISEMDKFKVQSSRIVQEIQETAKKWTVKIPAYKILPNITQIASKLCKCEQSITSHLETLVLKVLLKYPHTTIWKISNYIISKDPMRKDKYNFIVAAIKSRNGSNQIWNEYLKLIPLLVDLCTFNDSKEMNIFISKSIPKLKLLSMSNIAAPTYWTIYRSSQIEKETVFFCELEDRVEIFPSLQRPKKVAVICTDGLKRIFLFKPKDDLRKDMRFLELAVLINSLLLSSGKIKVYSALPLNEDAGIIEWVDQTTSLRSILYKLYKEINLSIQYPEFQKIQRQSHLVKKFVNAVLPRFPPQLQRWFMRKFLSPFEWFKARHIFIKSTSTISIFGHIMGLGDRHCENILICEDDGQCMHVDFNCLFEKGKSLEIPEKVPFRLTQNLTSAFGSSGNIGEFHSQCTKVIKSLKININLIIANLEPMINDPTTDLMVFANKDRTINQMTYKKDVNYVMSRIKDKLSGLEDKLIFKTDHSQVTHLIEQATNPELLSRMYIGWAPFL